LPPFPQTLDPLYRFVVPPWRVLPGVGASGASVVLPRV
jgi:hypothetical protein